MAPFDTDLVDIDYPRAILLILLVVVNVAIVTAVATSGTAYGPYNSDWDGTSELRTLAGEQGEVTVAHDTSVYETASPDAVAIVVAPQEPYGPTDRARIQQFVQRGGTLVVASEDDRTNDLLADLDVEARVDGALLRDEQEHYRNASLAIATGVEPHRYTEDVDGLTLNYGSAVNVSRADTGAETPGVEWQGTYLVNSSRFAYLDRNRNEALDDDEEMGERPVAVAEPVGSGTVVVVSDASVFTNAMLERDGNRQFVTNIVTSHDPVFLDHSHGHPLPPLTYVLLIIRSEPIVQFLLGGIVVGGVALWTGGWTPPGRWRRRLSIGGRSSDPPATVGRLDADELAAFLAAEHPEWDEDRVERVTEAIIRRREQPGNND